MQTTPPHSLGRHADPNTVDDLHREYIDVEVEFDRKSYRGTQSRDTKQVRIVGVHKEDADN